jgi:hypothetical protein
VQDSWIRRSGSNAAPEDGWVRCCHRGSHSLRRRWDHRRSGITITFSKPTAHANGVPADPHQVGCAPGDSQSDADETESRTFIEPANRGADTPSRINTDTLGDEGSLAAADPRGDHHDPDSHCSAEPVDRHSDGDCQPIADGRPIADCQPIAFRLGGGRVCRYRHSFLVLVGAGGFVTCGRGSDSPSRAGAPSTTLEG